MDENLKNSSGTAASGFRLQVMEEEYQKALKVLNEEFIDEKYSPNSSSPKLIVNLIASAFLLIFLFLANRDIAFLYKNFSNFTSQDKIINSIEVGFDVIIILGCIGIFFRNRWALYILLIGLFKELTESLITYDNYVSQTSLTVIVSALLILFLAVIFFSSKRVMKFFKISKRGFTLFSSAVLGVCFVLPMLVPNYATPDALSSIYLIEQGNKSHYNGLEYTGIILDRYQDGMIDAKGYVKDGYYEGFFLKFDRNGNIEYNANYKRGKLNGRYQEWYSDGNIRFISYYKDGLKDSLWKEFYPNGKSLRIDYYNKDIKVGKSTEYYKSGIKKEQVHFNNGLKDGAYSSWFEDGTPNTTGFYILNKKDSIWIEWLNNKKFSQETYRHDKKHGLVIYWDKEGFKIEEGFYDLGSKSGTWTQFNKEGEVVAEKIYTEGGSN